MLCFAPLWLAAAAARPAPPVTDTASFVTTLGHDTVVVESYRLTSGRLEGDILLRTPRTYRFHYQVSLNPDGTLRQSVMDLTSPDAGSNGRYRTTITRRGDSLQIDLDTNGVQQSVTRAASPATLPEFTGGFGSDNGLDISFGMYQLLASRLDAPVGKVVDVPTVAAFGGNLRTKELVRRTPSQVDVDYFRIGWTRLLLNSRGQIESANAIGTTEKTRSVRTAWISIDSAAKVFARIDKAGHTMGQLSPPAQATAHLGGTTISIRYSSPRARGRVILGATVPYDTVWRTGANAATVLALSGPVSIGGKQFDAGTYTLWTIPGDGKATLIINGQSGQWGTDYDATRDVARVPMQVTKPPHPVEDFTIEIPTHGTSGELRISWGDFVWSVPLVAP